VAGSLRFNHFNITRKLVGGAWTCYFEAPTTRSYEVLWQPVHSAHAKDQTMRRSHVRAKSSFVDGRRMKAAHRKSVLCIKGSRAPASNNSRDLGQQCHFANGPGLEREDRQSQAVELEAAYDKSYLPTRSKLGFSGTHLAGFSLNSKPETCLAPPEKLVAMYAASTGRRSAHCLNSSLKMMISSSSQI
jgi:hypothetical protein